MKRLLFWILLIILFAMLAEFVSDLWFAYKGLRAYYGKGSTPETVRSNYPRDRFAPTQEGISVNGRPVSINSLGFRGREPDGDDVVIVCLGDSVTFGWDASDDNHTYPAQLERYLLQCGIYSDVINAAMPGWNTMQLMDLYVTDIAALKPDYVVILAGWNDIAYEFALHPERRRTVIDVIAENSNGVSLIRDAAKKASKVFREGLIKEQRNEAVIKARDNAQDAIDWSRVDKYEKVLKTLVSLIRQDGSTPVLVTLPHFMSGTELTHEQKRKMLPHLWGWPHVGYRGWRDMALCLNARIRTVAGETRTCLIDAENMLPSDYFTDTLHLDDEGNERLSIIVGDALRKMVMEQF